MKVQHGKDLANYSGPESCGGACEGAAEALAGETGGSAIEPRNQNSGTPTQLSDAEGKTDQGDRCESWGGPARSETLHTPGSFLHRSWEISAVPGETTSGSSGKAKSRTPGQRTAEKSDALVVPGKPSNKGEQPAEMVEGRSAAKGNAEQDPAPRTQSRNNRASTGLQGVRQAARRDRRLRFTALLHHITAQLLMDSFYSLQKNAAAGVKNADGEIAQATAAVKQAQVNLAHTMIRSPIDGIVVSCNVDVGQTAASLRCSRMRSWPTTRLSTCRIATKRSVRNDGDNFVR